ncbi:ABC transporter permease, partial [Streptomyces sp. URMC 126]
MTPLARLSALGRAELTLLFRNPAALIPALSLPALAAYVLRLVALRVDGLAPERAGLTPDEATVTAAFGCVLLLAVHRNLVGAYVARREESVLKRLRAGEAGEGEVPVS